jgi:hypothetical protein
VSSGHHTLPSAGERDPLEALALLIASHATVPMQALAAGGGMSGGCAPLKPLAVGKLWGVAFSGHIQQREQGLHALPVGIHCCCGERGHVIVFTRILFVQAKRTHARMCAHARLLTGAMFWGAWLVATAVCLNWACWVTGGRAVWERGRLVCASGMLGDGWSSRLGKGARRLLGDGVRRGCASGWGAAAVGLWALQSWANKVLCQRADHQDFDVALMAPAAWACFVLVSRVCLT